MTSEGRTTQISLSLNFPATFWPHLLPNSHSLPPPFLGFRVRQVPGGESQSCRGGPQLAIAPQWRTGRSAGNPQPQEAGEAGGHFARHVDPPTFALQIPTSPSSITRGQTDLTLKHLRSDSSQHYLFSHY